jgi:quercetin dioxygenase-like cupin family protein
MPDPPEVADLAALVGPWSTGSEDLRSRLIVLEPGRSLPAHVNQEVDLVLVGITGLGRVRIDDQAYRLGPGQALQVPKGVARQLQSDGPESWRVLVVHRRTALSPSWRWRPRRRRPWEDPWEELENS